MEVAARGTGGSLTPDHSRVRLNVTLYVVATLCLCAVIFATGLMFVVHSRDDGDRSGNWFEDTVSVISDQRVDPAASRIGEDVGDATVEGMDPASEEEQVRVADQIEAGTKMANAFLNLRYDDIEANIAAVSALATGPFLRQWTKATTSKTGLVTLIKRAKATQTGEVVWAGLVSGDTDGADVIVATNGTIANKKTRFKPHPRTYRLQLHLELVDGQWLTSDLQYVK